MSMTDQQVDIITAVYSEFHSHVRANQDIENKVAFAVSASFLVFSGLVLRRQFGSIPFYEVISISSFIFFIAILTSWYLRENAKRIKWQCQRIVDFEKLMGLYDVGSYSECKTVLPLEAVNWAKQIDSRFNPLPYIIGVVLTALAAILSLSIGYLNFSGNDNNHPRGQTSVALSAKTVDVSLQVSQSKELQQSLDVLNATVQQLNKTIDILIPAVTAITAQKLHSVRQNYAQHQQKNIRSRSPHGRRTHRR